MSHFTVLVIGENPEEQLAPFQENNMEDCPKEYLEFQDREDEYLKEYETGSSSEFYTSNFENNISNIDLAKMRNAQLGEKFTITLENSFESVGRYVSCSQLGTEKEKIVVRLIKLLKHNKPTKKNISSILFEVERVPSPKEIKHKEKYKTFEEFVKEYEGNSSRDSDHNRYGYWENPNAKWDWYQFGGRWSGFLKLKPGKKGKIGEKSWSNKGEDLPKDKVDQAKKGDVDWVKMNQENFESNSKTYDEFEKLLKEDPEKAKSGSYWEFGIKNVGTKDKWKPQSRAEFLKSSFPATFAVLKDGEWYENGEMGWWGCVNNEKDRSTWAEEFKKLVMGLPDDTLLSVYDCHI